MYHDTSLSNTTILQLNLFRSFSTLFSKTSFSGYLKKAALTLTHTYVALLLGSPHCSMPHELRLNSLITQLLIFVLKNHTIASLTIRWFNSTGLIFFLTSLVIAYENYYLIKWQVNNVSLGFVKIVFVIAIKVLRSFFIKLYSLDFGRLHPLEKFSSVLF